MPSPILMGPVLQFAGYDSQQAIYNIRGMVVTSTDQTQIDLQSPIAATDIEVIGTAPVNNPKYKVWRFTWAIPVGTGVFTYSVLGESYSFTIAGPNTPLRFAYGSCNGFSSLKLLKEEPHPYDRWQHLRAQHQINPYHLFVLGGDQVYSDAMWDTVKSMKDWFALPLDKRIKTSFNKDMEAACDKYFADLYVQRWSNPDVKAMFAQVPTLMIWDDHDIMDGWGSYDKALHECDVFQGIYKIAQRYYRLFQQMLKPQDTHPSQLVTNEGIHLAFEPVAGLSFLAMDLRSERRPDPNQIVGPQSWDAIFNWLEQAQQWAAKGQLKHLVVLSSVPVAYLDLSALEQALNTLPGQQELEDDLRDHWRSRPHQQERLRLIYRLLGFAKDAQVRVTIISGDVHVGGLVITESKRHESPSRTHVINQLISSGITHPSPPALVKWALEQFCGGVETIDHDITATLSYLQGKKNYLIGQRNWLSVEMDDIQRLWCHWHIEGDPDPATKVIHPPVVAGMQTNR